MKQGQDCMRNVNLIDLYPTLIDLCGLPEKKLDGKSFKPLLHDPMLAWLPTITTQGRGNHSVMSDKWHYITRTNGADELYEWLTNNKDMVLLDVRNAKDFGRFQVESPYPFEMLNISYFDFMEIEDECIARLPDKKRPVRVVCASEGSAKFVAEILEKHGFENIGYLKGGIKSWGNLLVPVLLNPGESSYEMYQFIRPGKASCSYGLAAGGELMLFDPSRNVSFYESFANIKD